MPDEYIRDKYDDEREPRRKHKKRSKDEREERDRKRHRSSREEEERHSSRDHRSRHSDYSDRESVDDDRTSRSKERRHRDEKRHRSDRERDSESRSKDKEHREHRSREHKSEHRDREHRSSRDDYYEKEGRHSRRSSREHDHYYSERHSNRDYERYPDDEYERKRRERSYREESVRSRDHDRHQEQRSESRRDERRSVSIHERDDRRAGSMHERDDRRGERDSRHSRRSESVLSETKPSKWDAPPPRKLTAEEIEEERIQQEEEKVLKAIKAQETANVSDLLTVQREAREEVRYTLREAEDKIRERKLRVEQWRKEKELEEQQRREQEGEKSSGGQETSKKAWNLEDDDSDGDQENTGPISVDEDGIYILKVDFLHIEKEPVFKKPKRTVMFGVKAKDVVGKSVVEFGLKKIIKKTPVHENRVAFEDDEDDMEALAENSVTNTNTDNLPSEQSIVENQVNSDQVTVPNVDTKAANIENEEGTESMAVDEEEDPLESFMNQVHQECSQTIEQDKVTLVKHIEKTNDKDAVEALSDVSEEEEEPNFEINRAEIIAAAEAKLAIKKKELLEVDHSKMKYEPFRKDFYKEPPDLAKMTEEEVDQKRLDLDGIHVRGKNCPKPVEKWTQFGMPPGVHEVIKKLLKYERPTPIQAQAIPAIMSGRDVIGISKTGSGKTMAFILPMFRHIKDQRPSGPQEGPIGLVMTPTRELAVQIHREIKHFTKVLNLRAVCCYGGSPIKDQIAELKKGADIIVCTPGRMIDLLCANNGRVTNLKRVTYLVLDEADRMFDLGFEPQVMRMIGNVRPDRQCVLFSATFPRFMEALARKILKKPLEILVGVRSIVAPDVTQIVEVIENEEAKFLRLLAVLGKCSAENPNSKFLIFVDRQEAADAMLSNLFKRGYPCLALHGGKDQADRDSVISDFKNGATNILVATSIGARGLDVKDLNVVINYECPNHHEDYVHRCGRTGRAGNKGTAYTFILHEQAAYGADIIKALTQSGVPVPKELDNLVQRFLDRARIGLERIPGSGFGGRGLAKLVADREQFKKIQAREHGGADLSDEEEVEVDENGEPIKKKPEKVKEKPEEDLKQYKPKINKPAELQLAKNNQMMLEAKERLARNGGLTADEKARQAVIEIAKTHQMMGRVTSDAKCWDEIEVNDYAQKARMKVTSKETVNRIINDTGCAITVRGEYVQKGKRPRPGVRKLFLFIEADNQWCIDRAKAEIKAVLIETEAEDMAESGQTGTTIGRYTVL
ncbi:pre-mRNA processing RNA-helicase [Boothiomyces macroporosus]|uniref:RNA helicase n=1 Tax=Boothiomyces macroporosus TaxID=261099 RepID=A0AAD5UDF4_9FUNG|nr:pre-mRNA processing RNA-helicase [Boothiomyces macroporosus]